MMTGRYWRRLARGRGQVSNPDHVLIAGGTGIGAVAAVLAVLTRLTDNRHRLRLDRLAPARK